MTPFSKLLVPVPGLSAAEVQQRANQVLPDRVRDSALRWWSPDQPPPTGENILLVGAAVWSGYDLNTLDHMNAAVEQGHATDLDVFVFDADSIQSHEQAEAIFPGIGFVHHTPMVGVWRDGRLVETACGYHGRLLIARTLGIDPEPLHVPSYVANRA